MSSFTIIASEAGIPRNGLNFYFDAQYQNNRPDNQVSSDRSGTYNNFTFSNAVQIFGDNNAIRFDGGDFINLPINVSNVSQCTWIYWTEGIWNEIVYPSLIDRGELSNNATGSRFIQRYNTAGEIYYNWGTTSVNKALNSKLTPPVRGPYMVSFSISSTGATLSMIDKKYEKKYTFRDTSSHNTLSFTQCVYGRAWSGPGAVDYRPSENYHWKLLFWTRDLSDTEVNRVFEATKRDVPGINPVTYVVIGTRNTGEDTKAQVCNSKGAGNSVVVYYTNIPLYSVGTGSYVYSDSGLSTPPSQQFLGQISSISPSTYIKINTTTGQITEFGPC